MNTQFPVALTGAKALTFMWANEADIDPKAIDQLHNIARLPTLVGTQPFTGAELGFWGRFGALHQSVHKFEARARQQLGTLGGGNHFIEVCLD